MKMKCSFEVLLSTFIICFELVHVLESFSSGKLKSFCLDKLFKQFSLIKGHFFIRRERNVRPGRNHFNVSFSCSTIDAYEIKQLDNLSDVLVYSSAKYFYSLFAF